VGHVVAGPIAASVLADFGADVIKIERPVSGDPLRWLYPKNGAGLFYKMEARNKRCITLDLKQPEGRELFHRLVAESDVVMENFRPGVMERLGHDWETLRRINPRLVFCRLSGFGQTGPYAERRAYGRIGEAFAGFAHITGLPDGPPMHSAMSVGDTIAGVWAAIGIINALYWRDAQGGGVGQVIDVGLYEPLFRQIEQQVIVHDQLDRSLMRVGNENPGDPYVGSFRTKDDRYFSFSAATAASILDVLRAMGMDDDERFNDFERCLEHRDEFQAAVTAWMGARTVDEVNAAFQKYDAPGSPVMSAEDLAQDPHILARDMIITVEDAELGPIRMQGVVPKMSETPGEVRHAGQPMGTANEEIYAGLLGLSSPEIADLRDRGII
jgi:crotonobetainyl-CoA:carnitine CoA-transferase CaiB-like acyl-CoA transferase